MYLIYLPRLGQTMETGVITRWHRAEGESFASGDVLYEVETDKSTTDVEARQDGRLARINTSVDHEVSVGTLLAIAADPGEELSEDDIMTVVQPEGKPDAGERATPAGTPGPRSGIAPSPEPDSYSTVAPAGTTGSGEPTRTGHPEAPRKAYPRARQLAKNLGLDLDTLTGTGRDGAVTTKDVRAATSGTEQMPAPSVGSPVPPTAADSDYQAGPPDDDVPVIAARIPVRGVWRSMADSVTRSWQQVPQFIQEVTADATALVARHQRLRYEGTHVTYTDLLVGAVAATAAEVPEVNAQFGGSEVLRLAAINVSVATATDRGLIVPVVHGADQLGPAEISARTRDLSERAQHGALGATDLQQGTITLSNLGAYGVESGTPLINAPQAVIVFAGSITEQPVARNGQLLVRQTVQLCIAYDHRVADGATAARFTTALQRRVHAGG